MTPQRKTATNTKEELNMNGSQQVERVKVVHRFEGPNPNHYVIWSEGKIIENPQTGQISVAWECEKVIAKEGSYAAAERAFVDYVTEKGLTAETDEVYWKSDK